MGDSHNTSNEIPRDVRDGFNKGPSTKYGTVLRIELHREVKVYVIPVSASMCLA